MADDFASKLRAALGDMTEAEENFLNSFDLSTWSTIRALIRVLHRSGKLSDADIRAILDDMEDMAKQYAEAEPDAGEIVREAAAAVALAVDMKPPRQ